MKIIVLLNDADLNDEIVKAIAHLNGQTIEVMTEDDVLALMETSEDARDAYAGVDWETYRYVMPCSEHDYYSFKEEWVVNAKFNAIYNLFENASAIMVNGRVTNDWSLEEKDELRSEVANDENPIVISIYGAKLDDGGSFYVPLEYYFDYSDLCDAKIESDCIMMKDEAGAAVQVYVFTNATPVLDESSAVDMALQHEENGTDFVLTGESCWITVNNISVRLKKDEEGVEVEMFPLHHEIEEPLSSACVLFSEVMTDEVGEDGKSWCPSCKMDMHFDEIGNCKGCGNFIDGGAV